jgi:hypothetical protein
VVYALVKVADDVGVAAVALAAVGLLAMALGGAHGTSILAYAARRHTGPHGARGGRLGLRSRTCELESSVRTCFKQRRRAPSQRSTSPDQNALSFAS